MFWRLFELHIHSLIIMIFHAENECGIQTIFVVKIRRKIRSETSIVRRCDFWFSQGERRHVIAEAAATKFGKCRIYCCNWSTGTRT